MFSLTFEFVSEFCANDIEVFHIFAQQYCFSFLLSGFFWIIFFCTYYCFALLLPSNALVVVLVVQNYFQFIYLLFIEPKLFTYKKQAVAPQQSRNQSAMSSKIFSHFWFNFFSGSHLLLQLPLQLLPAAVVLNRMLAIFKYPLRLCGYVFLLLPAACCLPLLFGYFRLKV